jgi:hypothetical protein
MSTCSNKSSFALLLNMDDAMLFVGVFVDDVVASSSESEPAVSADGGSATAAKVPKGELEDITENLDMAPLTALDEDTAS